MNEKLRQALIRINATERALLNAIIDVSEEHKKLTTAEIGAALLKIMVSTNDREINDYCK